MKLFIFTFVFSIFFLGCDPEKVEYKNTCDQTTIINANDFANTQINNSFIDQIIISGNCLNVKYSSSGCSGNTWVVKLISDGQVDNTTNPATRKVRLRLDNNELCLAVFQKEKSFDIKNLQIPGKNSVKILLENSNESIIYNY